LIENKTFTLVERSPRMHVLPCRYVFRVKQNSPKVRIVAKGFRQIHGVDYHDTFAPVVSLTAVRFFLSIVAHKDFECDQMDVVTAFLNGDIDEEIYMDVPAGFKDPKRPNLVCKLLKALYGLKQAPRMWNAKIDSFLVENLGFFSSPNEPCVYIKRVRGNVVMIILLYVDDILIGGKCRSSMDKVKAEFKARFKMKDLGDASEFLGIEIMRDRNLCQIEIKQSAYMAKILERFSMSNCKPMSTPMITDSAKILESESNLLSPKTPYRSAIGSLLYLMICTSSDWGGCLSTRKSTEGVLFTLGGTAVSWKSKRQSVVALSTCEAEYIASCSAAKEAIYLGRLLFDMLGATSTPPVPIHVDNDGAIDLTKKEAVSQRTKHIDIRYHYIRKALRGKHISLHHIDTKEQLADLLTKSLGPIIHRTLSSNMGVSTLSS